MTSIMWFKMNSVDSTLKIWLHLFRNAEQKEERKKAFKFKYFIFNYAFYMHLHGCLSLLVGTAQVCRKVNEKQKWNEEFSRICWTFWWSFWEFYECFFFESIIFTRKSSLLRRLVSALYKNSQHLSNENTHKATPRRKSIIFCATL